MKRKKDIPSKNILGPFLKGLRLKAGLSRHQVANRFTEWGAKCTPERVERIEKQQTAVRDVDMLIFSQIFPGHRSEMADVIRGQVKKKARRS